LARRNLRRGGADPIVVGTGGSRRVGLEICCQLAARGAYVVLTARKPAAGAAAVKKLAAQKLAVEFRTLDSNGDSIAALRDFLRNAFDRLDVLIDNAGIIAKGKARAPKVGLPTICATLETNALGPLRLAQRLMPLLRRGTSPRMVKMSSGMGELADNDGGYTAYRISKTALNAVIAILPAELRGAVAVNAACPG
jgi:NAD(P)-dependent dehydrogenase (short-subunit alcohol dehydrogenase family)